MHRPSESDETDAAAGTGVPAPETLRHSQAGVGIQAILFSGPHTLAVLNA